MTEPVRGDVRIREAAVSDREFVLELVPELHSFGPPAWRDPHQMTVTDRRVIADALSGRSPGASILIAESITGERFGFIHVCEEDDYYRGPCGHIGDVVVAPSGRGRGVGCALLEAAEEWARARGYAMLTLNVFQENQHAWKVYEAAGFNAETTRFVKEIA